MSNAAPASGMLCDVPGSMLSCYTAAIATYLQDLGVDALERLGSQLHLSVRQRDGALPEAFNHYHTSLIGPGTYVPNIALRQRTSKDPARAVDAIMAELDRTGAAIVVGDTGHLPWLVTHGQRSAPHWFVLRARPGGRIEADDPFEWLDDTGLQLPHRAAIDENELRRILPVGAWSTRDRSRHRHAFGGPARVQPAPAGQCAWFEKSDGPPKSRTPLAPAPQTQGQGADVAQRIRSTWHRDLSALGRIADAARRYLSDPRLYELHNDLWVTGRTRALLAHTLSLRTGDSTRRTETIRLATLSAELWNRAVQVGRFNALRLERGREPGRAFETVLLEVAEAEGQLYATLAGGAMSAQSAWTTHSTGPFH